MKYKKLVLVNKPMTLGFYIQHNKNIETKDYDLLTISGENDNIIVSYKKSNNTIKIFSDDFSFYEDIIDPLKNKNIIVGPKDGHFNLEGHNIVSKKIINYLNKWHNQNTHLT